jgi:hypothetical protein
MTAVTESDMALPYGSPVAAETAPNARVRAPARARPMVAERGRKWIAVAREDVAGAWVWRSVPPPLTSVIASAKAPTNIPGNHKGLRAASQVYGFAVALPITAVGYVLVWLHQHPARAIPTDLLATALFVLWLNR